MSFLLYIHRIIEHSPGKTFILLKIADVSGVWWTVVIVTGCALFVTSHCDVKLTFQIQRFSEVF